MKIVLISDTVFDQNGVSRFIQDMASEAKKNEKALYVLTSSPIKAENITDNIINMQPFYSRRMPFYDELFLAIPNIRQFLNKIKELKPDFLHISTPGPVGMIALYASYKYAIPFTSTYHTDFPSYIRKNMHSRIAGRIVVLIMRFFYKKAKLVMARSSAYLEILQNSIQIEKENIFELRAGTDTNNFNPSYKNQEIWAKYSIDENAIKMLYVGRMSIEKNFPWLIQFYKRHYEYFKEKNVVLVVVGHGKMLKEAEKFKKQGINMLGIKHVPELSSIYASSDFFITPSVTETLGQVVLEAMACGLPCVVTNKGGPTKLINVQSENGFVLEPQEDGLWLDAAQQLIASQELRQKMGMNSFESIKNFSIAATFESFWNIHQDIFSKHG